MRGKKSTRKKRGARRRNKRGKSEQTLCTTSPGAEREGGCGRLRIGGRTKVRERARCRRYEEEDAEEKNGQKQNRG